MSANGEVILEDSSSSYNNNPLLVGCQGSDSEESRTNDSQILMLNPSLQSHFEEKYRKIFSRCRELATDEPTLVKLVPLSEALKVRTISKGPPFKYFCLQPLQKFMHGTLRNLKPFTLVGEPVSEEILRQSFGFILWQRISRG